MIKSIKAFDTMVLMEKHDKEYKQSYRAYQNSKQRELEHITFKDIIWHEDLPDILRVLSYHKVPTILLSDNDRGSLQSFQELAEHNPDISKYVKNSQWYVSGDVRGVLVTLK